MNIIPIIIIILAVIAVIWLMKKFKIQIKTLPTGSFVTVVGGVKCGKTTYAVHLAKRNYNSALLRYYIRKYIFFRKDEERPLFYSNIPVAWKYVPLTQDLLMRKTRFNYKSVILIDEASLVADSMSFKNIDAEAILLLCKLVGHETKGGLCVLSTHCVQDLHYGFKRVTSQYQYITKLIKWIPFILVAKVVEQRYSEDGSIIATDTQDIDDITKNVIIPKSIWKKFDAYCYSKLTDNLPREERLVKTNDLKTDIIVSFNKGIVDKNKTEQQNEKNKEQNNKETTK